MTLDEIMTKFIKAVGDKDVELTKSLLVLGASPNEYNGYPLMLACDNGDMDMIKLLISYYQNAKDLSHALRFAAKRGHMDVVNLLLHNLKEDKSKGNYDDALVATAGSGHMDIFKKILPFVDNKSILYASMCEAIESDYMNIIEIILPLVDPRDFGSRALRLASEFNRENIVRVLINISDPKASESEALVHALKNDNKKITDLLFDLSDVKMVREKIIDKKISNKTVDYFNIRYEALLLKDILTDEICSDGRDFRKKKII